MIDIQATARRIAAAAASGDGGVSGLSRTPMRRRLRLRPQCQLRNFETVLLLLNAVSAGLSHKRAAHAARIAEPTFRLWMANGRIPDPDGDHPYTIFRSAVEAIEDARKPKPSPAPPPSVVPRVVVSPPPTPKPLIPPMLVHKWCASLDRADMLLRCRSELQNMEGKFLKEETENEMRARGITRDDLPATVPRLNLPAGMSWPDIQRQYIDWCRLTWRGNPTDSDVEMHARRWYLDHVITDTPAATDVVLV
jgi:hypothetical protein